MVEATNEAEIIDQLIKINVDETLLNQFQPRPELKNLTVYDLQAIEEYMAVLIDEARQVLNHLLSTSAAVVETTEEQQPVQSEFHEALNLKPQVESECDMSNLAETKADAEAIEEDIVVDEPRKVMNKLMGAFETVVETMKNSSQFSQRFLRNLTLSPMDTDLTSIKKTKVRRGTRGGGRKINYKKTPEGQTKNSDTLTEPQLDVTEKPNSKPLDETKLQKEELPDDEKVEAPKDHPETLPQGEGGQERNAPLDI